MAAKKGITPVIAVILIVMITVAAAGSMFFWITRIQNQGQGAVENSQSILLERIATCVDIPSMRFNVLDNKSRLAIQNCGTSEFILGDGDDNALITSEPCAFLLNCSMVVSSVCPVTMLPGTYTRIDLDMNAVACSGSTSTPASLLIDQESITHQLILSVDKKTTAARSFVPESTAECSVSLAYAGNTSHICYNLTLHNKGNTQDTFTLSFSNTSIGGTFYTSAGCSGTTASTVSVASNTTTTISVTNSTAFSLTIPGVIGACFNATSTATSTNCNNIKSTAAAVAFCP